MIALQRSFYPILSLGIAAVLSACSSVTPALDSSQALDPVSCLKVVVQGPDSVVKGESFTARFTTRNSCDDAIQVPVATSTAISSGKDTGVEISFHLVITDPMEASGGYPVRWQSVDSDPSYVESQKIVTLAPGDELVRNISWNGRLDSGKPLPDGDYVLFGFFYYEPNGLSNKDFDVIPGQKSFKVISD